MKPKTVSVENLDEVSAQDTYNFIAHHLLIQGRKAGEKNERGFTCLYKDDGGNKCAAGCLIPNKLYKKEMEIRPWDCGGSKPGVCQLFNFSTNHGLLINKLQEVHDEYDPEDWKGVLGDLARAEGLSAEILVDF